MALGEARGGIAAEVGLKEVAVVPVVVEAAEPAHHGQLAGVAAVLLRSGIAGVHVGEVVGGEVLALSVVVVLLEALCVPAQHGLEVVLGDRLVVVQVGIEVGAMPVAVGHDELVGLRSLVGIILDEFLEVAVALRVVDVGALHGKLQVAVDLPVHAEQAVEVLVVALHVHARLQPSHGAAVRHGAVAAVLILVGHPGGDTVEQTDNLVAATTIVGTARIGVVVVDVGEVHVGCDRLGEVHVQVGAAVELLPAGIGQHTALLEVAGTGHIAHILIATRYIEALSVLEARLVSQVIPVGVGMSVGVGTVSELLNIFVGENRTLARARQSHIIIGSVLGRAHAVHQSRGIGESVVAVVLHAGLAVLTALRSDEDHAVGGLRTVDGGRCGVLQYGDTLNVLRVERVDIAGLHTVYEDVGAGVVERTHTTNADATAVHTGGAGRAGNGDTGHEALQTGGYVVDGSVVERLAVDLGHRSGEVGFLLGAIADDNNLIE